MNGNTRAVVVAVDGTAGSAGALRYAADEAGRRGAPLRIVHVSPTYVPLTPMLPYVPDDLTAAGRAVLREAEATVSESSQPGAPSVETVLLSGGRVSEIVTAGDGAGLLVLGRETRHGLDRWLLGATTAAVAAHASVPTVAVPADWTRSTTRGLVVVGVKSSHGAPTLLDHAFATASARGATLRVVHAWSLPDPYGDRIEERTHAAQWLTASRMQLDRLLEPLKDRYPDVPVEVVVLHEQPARALLGQADQADLVVLLRSPSTLVPGRHLGSTARALLAHATTPVEVVPAVGAQPATRSTADPVARPVATSASAPSSSSNG
jgi:nucleotide-binding universal stress UspA family protein